MGSYQKEQVSELGRDETWAMKANNFLRMSRTIISMFLASFFYINLLCDGRVRMRLFFFIYVRAIAWPGTYYISVDPFVFR